MQLISLEKKIEKHLIETERNAIRSLLEESKGKNGLEIEIGCGNGHFLIEYARTKKEHLLMGIDMKNRRCLKTQKKIGQNKLDNIRVISGNAEEVISFLPGSSVDRYHIYFPDPWPKARHKKRRFFRMGNLEFLYKSLKPGGEIYFATDIFDYYLQAKLLFSLHPGLKLQDVNPPRAIFKSVFASRFTELEKESYFTAAQKI